MSNSILQRDQRAVRGTIAYTSNKPGREGQERGREYFHITVHSDGRRTCMAHSEIDDRPSVMRDIVYSLDAALAAHRLLRPPERQRSFHGHRVVPFRQGLRRVRDLHGPRWSRHAAHGNHAAGCRLSRTTRSSAMPGTCSSLTATRVPGVQSIDEMLLSSPDHRGATGPMLFRIGFGVEYVGEEKITVKAGTLRCPALPLCVVTGLARSTPPPTTSGAPQTAISSS
jgi:hypothetical protein